MKEKEKDSVSKKKNDELKNLKNYLDKNDNEKTKT